LKILRGDIFVRDFYYLDGGIRLLGTYSIDVSLFRTG
jgi:hypothetical protein